MVAALSPAGGTWVAELQLAGAGQHIPQPCEAHPLVGPLTEQFFQEGRSFEPPVSEQFGIEGGDQKRWHRHRSPQLPELALTSLQVVTCVIPDPSGGDVRLIGLFRLQRCTVTGHAMQLQAERPRLGESQWSQLLEG